jgi:hypothetical protein
MADKVRKDGEKVGGGENNAGLGTTSDRLKGIFTPILDEEEKILWVNKPEYAAYMFEQIKGFIFVIIAISFMAYKTIGFVLTTPESQDNYLLFYAFMALVILFLIASTFLFFWGSIVSIFSYNNVYYALTNKRIIFSAGIRKRSFRSIHYNEIRMVELYRKATQNLFGNASIGIKLAKDLSRAMYYSGILLIDNKDVNIACEIIQKYYLGRIINHAI